VSAIPFAAAAAAHPSQPALRLRRFLRTPKGRLTLVFLPLLLLAGTSYGWAAALPHVLSAVAGACALDLLAFRLLGRAWRWPDGALLSGLIVAFVLGPETPWAVTLVVGAAATASKHMLVFGPGRGHVFNPAALALLVSVPVFAAGHSWWGALPELPWPWLLALLAGGAIVVDRVDKFPLALAFAGTYFGLFTLAALTSLGAPARVAEMFRPPFVQTALFVAVFMVTDPPTAPGRYADQVWIGALVAGVAVAAQLLGIGQSYLLVGLLAGNLAWAGRRWAMAGGARARALPAARREG
jgi:Na+-translocating ferredoxin:NAD+ oxidoreductase RnfD subunit